MYGETFYGRPTAQHQLQVEGEHSFATLIFTSGCLDLKKRSFVYVRIQHKNVGSLFYMLTPMKRTGKY